MAYYRRVLAMFCVILVGAPPMCFGANGKYCQGGSNWQNLTGSGDVSCGICAQEGIWYQVRTMDYCVNGWCWDNCVYTQEGKVIKRRQTITQMEVSIEEQQACTGIKTLEEAALIAGAEECATACDALLEIPPAYLVCEGACAVGYVAGMILIDCSWKECMYSCTFSGWESVGQNGNDCSS